MGRIELTRDDDGIATVTLARGKVNALDEEMVDELRVCLDQLQGDDAVRAVVLTGQGNFFSFGFDIPGFLSYAKPDFIRYLTKFTDLYTELFLFPKPVVAALNGHTIAGGCMLALACDARLMSRGRGKISLNEITFGAAVFAGSVEMLKHCAGPRSAETILLSGAMYDAEHARALGLVDRVTDAEELMAEAMTRASELARQDRTAFRSGTRRAPGSSWSASRSAEPERRSHAHQDPIPPGSAAAPDPCLLWPAPGPGRIATRCRHTARAGDRALRRRVAGCASREGDVPIRPGPRRDPPGAAAEPHLPRRPGPLSPRAGRRELPRCQGREERDLEVGGLLL
jgi:enoyl-CoA hydratase